MPRVKVIRDGVWVRYLTPGALLLDPAKCGKWMWFVDNKARPEGLCRRAALEGVVAECKHSDDATGACCFYLEGDDLEAHRRAIGFFLDNGMVRRTKAGRLYDIPFKYDSQTRAGQYDGAFVAQLKLHDFVDLSTGEWIAR